MIIDSWKKVTIGKYLEIKEVVDTIKNEDEVKVALLSILTGIDEDELLDMPLVRFNHLLQSIVFIYEDVPNTQVATEYVLGGDRFEVMLNIKDMTTAQFIDYQSFINDAENNLVPLLSIFLIPKGKKYNDGYDILEVQEKIKNNLSIVDAKSMTAFFLQWYKSLLRVTVHSLTKQMRKRMKKEKNTEIKQKMMEVIVNLERSGDGLEQLIG